MPDNHSHPLALFRQWLEDAIESPLSEAMALATVSADGRPSVRFVLLKALDETGLVFFTSYRSRKARQLEAGGRAAAAIFWLNPRRQVRAEGTVEKLDAETSDAYFATRERGSQLAAWASPQSEPIESRTVLEERMRDLEQFYQGRQVPRPDHWGGYRLKPDMLEFWTGRENRLHDRLRFTLQPSGSWTATILAP